MLSLIIISPEISAGPCQNKGMSTHIALYGWEVDAIITADDGLKIYNVKFKGTEIVAYATSPYFMDYDGSQQELLEDQVSDPCDPEGNNLGIGFSDGEGSFVVYAEYIVHGDTASGYYVVIAIWYHFSTFPTWDSGAMSFQIGVEVHDTQWNGVYRLISYSDFAINGENDDNVLDGNSIPTGVETGVPGANPGVLMEIADYDVQPLPNPNYKKRYVELQSDNAGPTATIWGLRHHNGEDETENIATLANGEETGTGVPGGGFDVVVFWEESGFSGVVEGEFRTRYDSFYSEQEVAPPSD